jgi:magnesium transporter
VDNYLPVVRGLEQDVDEIEVEVFDSHSTGVSRRIYELSREAAAFQRSVRALRAMLADLTAGFAKYEVPPALQDYLRDVTDHLAQIRSRSDEVHASLRDILTVNATLVAQQQNEEMRAMTEVAGTENVQTKKITSWAAIIFAPTVIAGLYGMNFDIMPELHWAWGYPMALGLMVASAAVLYWWFKRSDWI